MTGPYVAALRFGLALCIRTASGNKLHSTRNIPTNQINATVDSAAHARTRSKATDIYTHEHTMNTSIQLINGNMK